MPDSFFERGIRNTLSDLNKLPSSLERFLLNMPQIVGSPERAESMEMGLRNALRSVGDYMRPRNPMGENASSEAMNTFYAALNEKPRQYNYALEDALAHMVMNPESVMGSALAQTPMGMPANKIAGYLDDPFIRFKGMSDDAITTISEKLQRQIDDIEGVLLKKGYKGNALVEGSMWREGSKYVKQDPLINDARLADQLEELYRQRNRADQFLYEKSYNSILGHLKKTTGIDEPFAKQVMQDYHLWPPDTPTAVSFASEGTLKAINEQERMVQRLLPLVRENWERETGQFFEGTMGPYSGLTSRSKQELRQKLDNKTKEIATAMYEYFNRP